jgi:hypothetical protein
MQNDYIEKMLSLNYVLNNDSKALRDTILRIVPCHSFVLSRVSGFKLYT